MPSRRRATKATRAPREKQFAHQGQSEAGSAAGYGGAASLEWVLHTILLLSKGFSLPSSSLRRVLDFVKNFF